MEKKFQSVDEYGGRVLQRKKACQTQRVSVLLVWCCPSVRKTWQLTVTENNDTISVFLAKIHIQRSRLTDTVLFVGLIYVGVCGH